MRSRLRSASIGEEPATGHGAPREQRSGAAARAAASGTSNLAAYAAAGDRPEAIGTGIRALLDYIAAHELFARLAFFELPSAGPVALDRADEMLGAFTAHLRRDSGRAPIRRRRRTGSAHADREGGRGGDSPVSAVEGQ